MRKIILAIGLMSFFAIGHSQSVSWLNLSALNNQTFSSMEGSQYLSYTDPVECAIPDGYFVSGPDLVSIEGVISFADSTPVYVYMKINSFPLDSILIPNGNGEFEISTPYENGNNNVNLYTKVVGCAGFNCNQNQSNFNFYFIATPSMPSAQTMETTFPNYNLVEVSYWGSATDVAGTEFKFLKTHPNINGDYYPISEWSEETLSYDWPNQSTAYYLKARLNDVESAHGCANLVSAQPYIPPAHPSVYIDRYQYWFDNDLTTLQTTAVSLTQLAFLDIDLVVSSLEKGMHSYEIRFRDDNGNWSITESKYFYHIGVTSPNNIVAYEAWFDNDSDNRQYEEIGPSSLIDITGNIDATELSQGMHQYFIRFKDETGNWSITETKYFYHIGVNSAESLKEFTLIVK